MKHALSVSFVFFLVLRFILFLLFGPHIGESQHVEFVSRILDEPQVTKAKETFTVGFGNVFGSVPVRVKTIPTEQFNYQEKVKISGTLTKQALRQGGIIYTIVDSGITQLPSSEDKLIQFVSFFRKNVVSSFQKILPTNSATLLAGIVLGLKGDVTSQFKSALQSTGVMHIVAASGMNVTLVAAFFFAIFSKIFRRQVGVLFAGGCVIFYCFLSGLQPSILRAGVMMMLSLGAQFFGRQYDGVYALFLTAGLMVFFSPSLLYDVGFQLSVRATAGILFIKPLFPSSAIVDDLSTTTAAQLATLPILLGSFGQYGLTSILVNLLILWTVPILMILGGVGVLALWILPFVTTVCVWLSAPLLWYIEAVVEYFGKLPLIVTVEEVPWAVVVGYYLILISSVYLFKAHRGRKKAEASLPLLSASLPVQ